MKSLVGAIPFACLTMFCWGIYGPVLHAGKEDMGGSSLRQLVCVGLAYMVIAVMVPIGLLYTKGEQGRWTMGGAIWSLMAGICGALGALGIINALQSGGETVYVMPLVFGFAPVINTLVSMIMTRSYGQLGRMFFIGIGLVAAGAAGVMYFKPAAHGGGSRVLDLTVRDMMVVFSSIGMTALCWGSYGSVLHRGQMKMSGSRLRPLLCVGMAYFAIAVIVPGVWLSAAPVEEGWKLNGALWSLGAGAAGAFGALGIILSFTFGGKPIFVMPLVFGGAPVVNTFVSVTEAGTAGQLSIVFYLSLLTVICGAVMVLVFAPKPAPPPAAAAPSKSRKSTDDAKVSF